MADETPKVPDGNEDEEKLEVEGALPEDLDPETTVGGQPLVDEDRVQDIVDGLIADADADILDLGSEPLMDPFTGELLGTAPDPFTGAPVLIPTPEEVFEEEEEETAPLDIPEFVAPETSPIPDPPDPGAGMDYQDKPLLKPQFDVRSDYVEIPAWTLRDALDLVTGTAAAMQSAMEDWVSDIGDFLTSQVRNPLPLPWSHMVGKDKNGVLVIFALCVVEVYGDDRESQSRLDNLRSSIGLLTTTMENFGYAVDDDADDSEILVVPVYNGARSDSASITVTGSGCMRLVDFPSADDVYAFAAAFSGTPQTTSVTLLTDLVHIDDDTWEKHMATLSFECGVLTGVTTSSESGVETAAPADICVAFGFNPGHGLLDLTETFSKESSDINGKAAWKMDGDDYYVLWDSTNDRWIINDSTGISDPIAWQTPTSTTWPWDGFYAAAEDRDGGDYEFTSIDVDACTP